MSIPILVVDADREFAKLVQEKLEASGQYAVHVAPSGAAALAAAPTDSYRLAVVDFALPDLSGPELIRRLRAAVRGISVIALLVTSDGLPVEADELPPDGLLTKPVYMPELLQAVNHALGLATEGPVSPTGPWGLPAEFSDPAQLDPLLQRLSRECSAYAVLLTRKARLVAYAGSMPQPHVNEIVALLVKHEIREDLPGAVARFIRLPGAAEDFLLYALALNGQILLTLLYPARMPFSTVRVQGERLEAVLTGMAPEPVRAAAPRGGSALLPAGPGLPGERLPSHEPARGVLASDKMEPLAATARQAVATEEEPSPPAVQAAPVSQSATDQPATRAQEALAAAPIALPTICSLVISPRLHDHHLDGPLATRLQAWTARLCQAIDARPSTIDVRAEYLLVTVELPPHADPSAFVERLRGDLSDSLLAAYPGLAASLRGRRFWADPYILDLSGTPTPDAIDRFLHSLRLHPSTPEQ